MRKSKFFRTAIVLSIAALTVFAPPALTAGKPVMGIQAEASEYKTLYFDNAVYYGEASGNTPNGYGTKEYEDGGKYVGEWSNGYRNGHGTYYYADGLRWYEGSWVNGVKSGTGYFMFANGDTYED